MSKIKNYDLSMYSSISSAVKSILEDHRVSNLAYPVYTREGLDEVLLLLCVNDIYHSYTATSLSGGFRASSINSLISLSWEEDERICNYSFWCNLEVGEDGKD